MPIDIAHLEQQLLAMSAADAPGRGFCDAIAELARTNRIHQLRGVLPEVVYDELRTRYGQNPAAFVRGWRKLAQEMRHGFIRHARQRLTSLTRLQQARTATPAWQEIQCALDVQQNDLLRAAFALELLELVEPAVARATELRECVVAAPSTEEADRYLDEATRCYFYGLFTACAVMCRSVLEEAIKQKLPPQLARMVRTRYRNTATLATCSTRSITTSNSPGSTPTSPASPTSSTTPANAPSITACSRKTKPASASDPPATPFSSSSETEIVRRCFARLHASVPHPFAFFLAKGWETSEPYMYSGGDP
jgi:hypothetical protein